MVDLLQRGAAWLESQRRAHLVTSIVYRRGAESVEVDATIGRTPFETVNEDGLPIVIEARDYLIARAELLLGAVPVTPQSGDVVEETDDDGTPHRYEVMPFGNEPCCRFTDAYRLAWRVHTKLRERGVEGG